MTAERLHASGGAGYRNMMLVPLTAVTVMNVVARQLISILSPTIMEDLQLSDTQLGLLKGNEFALLYTLLGRRGLGVLTDEPSHR